MSAKNTAQGGDSRPRPLHSSRSFTRMEEPSSNPSSPRKRASTMQVSSIPAIPEARPIDASPELPGKSPRADVFENREDDEQTQSEASTPAPELQLPSTLDELPIEIRSLTERFLESLNAKVHPAPLTADVLSDMFQDFYERAASQISIHIATLASRIGRQKDSSSAASRNGKGRARAGSSAKRGESPASVSGGEMLTASEVTDRKKARKMLELKRVALEEAVERGVCEKVYDRIWKHRSTDDDARDEKLRSRTAALSLVGIGLKELHMDHDPAKEQVRQTAEEKEQEIYDSLSAAREALQRMDNEHYPLGKLQHLTAAHKSVVETLSQLFPSSASADEILPTLIYTLITSPPEGINVVSNLNFIQRFRSSSRVDGEAAYCLVNLEASISFLETVDLSSLRADELPEGPPKNTSRPTTPIHDKHAAPQPSATRTLKPETTPLSALSSDQSTPDTTDKHLPSPANFNTTPLNRPGMQHRRLSSMVQAQADRFEVGRDNFLNAADKVYDSINGTLENSLKSIFGRFKDQVPGDSPLPKTLEDARKLVSSPTLTPEDEYPSSLQSGHSSPLIPSDDPLSSIKPSVSSTEKDNKMLELLGGRKSIPRDRSVDSTRSHVSTSSAGGKRVAFSSATSTTPPNPTTTSAKPPPQQKDDPINAAANFMNSINPLNRFGVPSFPRFGGAARAASNPLATTPVHTPSGEKGRQLGDIVESLSTVTTPAKEAGMPVLERTKSHVSDAGGEDLNAIEALAELRKIKPPRKRFLEVGSVSELKIGEVEDLLMEYRRLAKAIGEAIAT